MWGKIMPKEESFQMKGIVTEVFANSRFRVKLEEGHTISAYPCGKMRRYFIRIIPGDSVTVELSPYDLNKGRITYRHK